MTLLSPILPEIRHFEVFLAVCSAVPSRFERRPPKSNRTYVRTCAPIIGYFLISLPYQYHVNYSPDPHEILTQDRGRLDYNLLQFRLDPFTCDSATSEPEFHLRRLITKKLLIRLTRNLHEKCYCIGTIFPPIFSLMR